MEKNFWISCHPWVKHHPIMVVSQMWGKNLLIENFVIHGHTLTALCTATQKIVSF